MKKKYENNELEQLIEDVNKYLEENPGVPPFLKARVESNPHGRGGEQKLWFELNRYGLLDSFFPKQYKIDGVEYAWDTEWTDGTYKGSIEILGFCEFKPFEL